MEQVILLWEIDNLLITNLFDETVKELFYKTEQPHQGAVREGIAISLRALMVSEPVERFLKEIFYANLLVGFLIRLGIHEVLILLNQGTKKIEVFATFWCANFALRVREMLH